MTNRPALCLNMIVRNEAHVIRRCLDSVAAYIDTWVIVDTGSTDGTQRVIREYFQDTNKPGELFEREWKNFGTNRNEALEMARASAQYILFIDADEVFEAPTGFHWPALVADGYQIRRTHKGSEYSHWTAQLVRSDKPWHWVGVLHEVLICMGQHSLARLHGPTRCGMFDSARNQVPPREKYSADALLLEAALDTEPNNARYVFYLAQSWRDAGENTKALDAYRRRANMPGFEEERWYAQHQSARMLETLGRVEEAIEAFLITFSQRPQRAEPLYELARIYRTRNVFELARLFAGLGLDMEPPDEILFIDASIYRWRLLDEYSVACYWLGQYAECLRTTDLLLNEREVPPSHCGRIESNRDAARAKLVNHGNG